MRVTAVGAATRLAGIQRLMHQAAGERPHLVELADRYAARFVVALLLLAALTALLWWWLEPARALWIFVAVLVVSCPCALSLATPAALAVASATMARRGLLLTRGHVIETLARSTHFVFDKTGTLTEGRPQIMESWARDGDVEAALHLAAALEQGSEHPLARAFVSAVGDAALPPLTQRASCTGAGVEACYEGASVRLGHAVYVQALHGQALPAQAAGWLEGGDSVVFLADAQGWRAAFRMGDRLRAGAAEMVEALQAQDIAVSIFSGDDAGVVQRLAHTLGIADARGNLTPEHKHAAVSALQAAGAVVAMAGDGVNDAPVLAQAQLSIAMGSGTDLARSTADAVLLGDDLLALTGGLRMARKTMPRGEAESVLGVYLQHHGDSAGYVWPGDALDGRHRHVGKLAAGGAQCLAPAGRACAGGAPGVGPAHGDMMDGMDILYLLVPLSVVLVFVIGVVFWWSLKSGQFEDLEGEGFRILTDDDTSTSSSPPASEERE